MRLLVANRGEIAVRVLRTAREMGVPTVAVYSDADADALHVLEADRAVRLGPAPPGESYLHVGRILAAARDAEATAVHPGYGFLAEDAAFAQAVLDAGLRWVGPSPAAVAAMGDKLGARRTMRAAKVPVVPGVETADPDEIAALGFPVMVKAARGGGGRGMRVVRDRAELADALADATSEAARAFGDGTVYAERLVEGPRHVEVQVLADAHGHTIHLGERECSVQRRHQKLLEEAPCAVLDTRTRERLCDAAVRAAKAVGYEGAGTVEFLLDARGDFHFLEMNTRIQVEHPVTEMVTGVDVVREQLRVADGQPLSLTAAPSPRGHAIECRIVAEDPSRGFLPSPGRLSRFRPPSGPGLRVDAGAYEGWTVPDAYDPLLAKLIAWAPTREAAIARAVRALAEFEIAGVPTTAELLRDVLGDPEFTAGRVTTAWLDGFTERWRPPAEADLALLAAWALATPARAAPETGATLPSPWATLGRWP